MKSEKWMNERPSSPIPFQMRKIQARDSKRLVRDRTTEWQGPDKATRQQVFIEHLLCARYRSQRWGDSVAQAAGGGGGGPLSSWSFQSAPGARAQVFVPGTFLH